MKKLDYIMRFARACVRHLWWGACVPSKSAREGRQAGSALMVEVFSKKRRGAHVGLLRGLCGGFNLGGGGGSWRFLSRSDSASGWNQFRLACFTLSALVASFAFAAPVPIERVQEIAGGVASSVQVSYASGAAINIAQAVSPAETTVCAITPTNSSDTAFYVIDRGTSGGFVVMSADDRLDPVIVIAPTGKFDPTPGTPLYDLLCLDARARVATVEANGASRSQGWRSLLEGNDSVATSIAYDGISSIDDVRVAPLVQSKWNQSTVGNKAVYNYYTPPYEAGNARNYVCGCVATAAAQIMRYHEFPKGNVSSVTRTCYVGGVATSKTMIGGTYSWENMPLVPSSSITDAECAAIGKLCYDMGVAIRMSWSSGGSGAYPYCLPDEFMGVFGYKNAIAWQIQSGSLSSTVIANALLANFDAGYPVELGIASSSSGHSIVGDGYGYSGGRLYVHLNLGWGGAYDAWYNLPNIGTPHGYNVVNGVVYNIFPDGTGDLITGRVLDASDGTPISGAAVQALDGSTVVGSATTSASGIYALRVPGGKEYTVEASAAGAETSRKSISLIKSVSTRTSDGIYYYPGTGTVGNNWGNDFALTMAIEPVVPEAPAGVSASDGTSTAKIRITWNASSGATYYKVYRATSNSSSGAEILASQVTSPYYDDTTADVGTYYYYWVKAGNASGESDFSASARGRRAYEIPNAPTGVLASDGTSTAGVIISWNAVASANSYSVWRGTSSSSEAAAEIASGLTSTSYTDTSAVAGTTYWYWVRATNLGGTSGWSNSDTGYRKVTAPSAPTGVTASDGLSSTEIVVSWNAVSTAASYEVWRGTSSSSSSASRIASSLTVTSYSDTSAVAGTTYYYWVKATNTGGTSGFSGSDTGYLAVVTGPSSVTASDGDFTGFVKVSWQASQNATSYEVWRGTVNAYSSASKIASPTTTSYDDTAAAPGALYYYWVRAVTTAGTSAFSVSDTGHRPLSVPTGIAATTGNENGVVVSWSSVAGATSYQIGRGDEGATAPSTTLGSATSLSYTDATAVPGISYAYFVRAVASACTSDWSASATGSRSVPTPTNLTASDGAYTDRVLVSWPTLSGATSYELMRSDEDDISSAETIATTSETSFSDTTAEYGLTYYYYLRANFTVGTSPWSASDSGWRAFPAPTGVSATDGANVARITVSWNEIEGATLFQVWRYSDERGRNELVGTSTSTSYNDNKNIVPGVRYKYCVKAVFATGTSGFSNYDWGYLKSSAPTVSASDGTSTSQISLTWSEASGVVAYEIYRSVDSSTANATKIGVTDAWTRYYNDTSASRGTLYSYWIRTVTAIDTSDFGTADTGYVGLPGISRVTATDGTYADKVVVSWSAVSGATSYEVWRGTSDESSGATRMARNITELTWDDTAATPGAKCWYWVKACDAGPGLWGASDSGWRKLSAPTDVSATTNQTDGVKVSWKGTTSGVSFEIKRGMSDNASQAEVVATIADKANYTDNTTVPGRRYYYWVRAYSELSVSDWSSVTDGFRAVSAPATVSATDGTSLDAVTVTWSAATSAKRYEIWRATTTKTDDAELLGATNKLVWVDASAEPGTLYYYWIKSVSALDTSAFSNRDSGYVSTPSPDGVTATDGAATNYVRVAWTEAQGALNYAVWRAETNEVTAAAQVVTGVTALEYDDKSVAPGKFYWYWVRPVSAAGPGVFAGPDQGFASLTTPIGVAATSNSETRVTVSWKRTNGAVSYEIFRAETNDVAFATNEVFATATALSYVDTNAFPAVKYWYWVRAMAEADISSIGGPADGFRLLSVPTGIAASDGTSEEFVKVSWNEAVGAASYEVWRAENSTSTAAASRLDSVTNEPGVVTNALEYLDTSAAPGVSYTYWVKAVSELHTTGFSAYDKGWRPLPAPMTVTASDGTTSDGVIVEWRAVPGALKYEVWRSEEATTNGASRVFTSADASTCMYTNTSAKAGVKYWYWVRTVATTGTGVFGTPDDGFRAVAAPTDLKATDGTSYDYVRVTWKGAAGAESYEVLRSMTNEFVVATNELYTATTNFYVTGTTFDDTNAVPGLIYSYWVRTVSPLSKSNYAGPDDGFRKLQKIADLVASDGTSLDAVELSWTVPTGASICQVWRSASSGVSSASKIALVETDTNALQLVTYSDTNALHGVKYYYWVNAVSDVEAEMSNSNDGWRGLLAPGNVQATDGDSTSHVRITWTVSPDATTYEILRYESENRDGMKSLKTLSSPAELVWEDTTGTAGQLYWYAVRAGGTGGQSASSQLDSGFKKLMPPTSVTATDGTLSGRVKVTWKSVTGATHYRVLRAESDDGAKSALGGWQMGTDFFDTSCRANIRYWYYVVAAADATGARPSASSAGDQGYTNEDGTGVNAVDLGGGISWPVTDNGDGTATTNAIAFVSVDGGRLAFPGVLGAVGSTSSVQALVKTSLDSGTVYTVPAGLTIVSEGTAVLDLSTVWGTRPSLFVIGITTTSGEVLP